MGDGNSVIGYKCVPTHLELVAPVIPIPCAIPDGAITKCAKKPLSGNLVALATTAMDVNNFAHKKHILAFYLAARRVPHVKSTGNVRGNDALIRSAKKKTGNLELPARRPKTASRA